MKKAKVKVCAKVNFTLDVGEKQNGYHKIQSLVSSIDLCDEITVTKRQDRRITLKNVGIDPNCNVVTVDMSQSIWGKIVSGVSLKLMNFW